MLGGADGDQPIGSVRKKCGIAAAALSTMTLVVGAFGNAAGRILSVGCRIGWDALTYCG